MKALILAAGLGSRLQSLTKFKPKALIEVAGKPIMAYQLDALIANGISHIGVVTGYQGDKIRSFVSKFYPNLRVCFFDNPIYDKSNSAYSFWLAKDFVIDSSYIHLNCDIVFSHRLLQYVIQNQNQNVLSSGFTSSSSSSS